MAELILSPLIETLFAKLASPAFEKLAGYAVVHSEVKKWEKSLSQIRALLNDASQKEITNEFIRGWLNRLRHLAYDIDDVLDDLATDVMQRELEEESRPTTSKVRKLIPSYCTSLSISYRMHDKLKNITTELQELEKEKLSLGLNVINAGPIKMNRNYETSLPEAFSIVGRGGEKEALLEKLLGGETCNENYSIVPIVGIGGVGKTTLARLLYNETKVQNHFELKAWVCVSDDFDPFKISKSIFESVTKGNNKEFKEQRNDKEFVDLNLLQVALKGQLNEKRFLLVLDDVWSEKVRDWDNLVGPFQGVACGSKIIMTTRKGQLLNKLGYANLNHLQSLSDDNALSLLSQHALGVNNFESHPTLRPHGEAIVKNCKGLPLALRAIGSLLRTKPDEEEWQQLLNSEIWRSEKEDGIGAALKLSYVDLSACLKQLFAYCSLFPKDFLFDNEELVLLWMAEGFLHQPTASSSTKESLGREYFEELLSRSFFQKAPNEESLFIMHDMMNDLATSVAEDFFFRSNNEMKKDVGKDTLEKYRHMSFLREEYMVSDKFKAFKGAKNLRTLLATSVSFNMDKGWWSLFHVSNKILANLVNEFPLLRVLNLSHLWISEVPESIGDLKHLRYLNLCRTNITCLPEKVCNLYNLQTLIVFGCSSLSKLPSSFLKLKNLRHFDCRDTMSLHKMPLGIGELKNLQTLSKIIIGGDNGIAMTELKKLKNLQGNISIEGLEKVENAKHAQELNFSQMRVGELELEWSDVFDGSRKEVIEEEVLDVLKPHSANLKCLKIVSYGGIKFPNWVGDPAFDRLTRVSIYGCKICTSLPPFEQLQSLKELSIEGMDEVKVIGFKLHGSGVAFASLEVLSFEDMQGWEVWSSNTGVVDALFPCLKELHIENCPNLVEVSLDALHSLRDLKISRCGHGVLKSLVRVAPLVTRLGIWRIIGLTDVLWRGVIEYLGAIEELRIESCEEIRYLWESEAEAGRVLVNLRRLDIWECKELVSLGEKEDDDCGSNLLTSLRILEVNYCDKIKHCNCPDNIEHLAIYCGSNVSVSLPLAGENLKSLAIEYAKPLENELFINPSNSVLEDLTIREWPNLKSIMDLSCFIHLKQLTIEGCPSLELFPQHQLSSLKEMRIEDCPMMDPSFPGGLWPPNLCFLSIGGLKKPFLEWGPQNFPASLADLILMGRSSEDDITSFSKLSHLLPSSLTRLRIRDFKNLKSLSKGLQHLTSLQHLYIFHCPKMKHLPQMLVPGLLSLIVGDCPKLKERCSKGGSYWRLISYIPFVDIPYRIL